VADFENKTAFSIGEWTADTMLNALSCNGKTHHIEPKVMKVLQVLASHPNQVVPREELMRRVWPATFVSDDVLMRCISLLRHIMQDNPHEPRYIQTIPKVGYRLLREVHPLPSSAEQTPEAREPVPVEAAKEASHPPPKHLVGHKPSILFALWVFVLAVVASIAGAYLYHRLS
jgi:DNA-binding winged helix-turn-helix (wHTH) protein